MKNKTNRPTESELRILQILWKAGASTVRMVNDKINEDKETGYTTTLKLMQIMFQKDLLARVKEGKTHLYTANIEEKDTKQGILDRFKDRVFGGSATQLVMQALGGSETSKEELEELKAFIEDLEKKHDNGSSI